MFCTKKSSITFFVVSGKYHTMSIWDTIGAIVNAVKTIGLLAGGFVVANQGYAQYEALTNDDCPRDLLDLWGTSNPTTVRIGLLSLMGAGVVLALLPISCISRPRRLAGSLVSSSTSRI